MRVEPAARARHRVDGNGGVRRQFVAPAVVLGQLPGVANKLAIGGAEIRSAGRSAVIAGAGCRGARLKILRPGKALTDEFGTYDGSAARQQTSVCAIGKQEVSNSE